MNELNGSWHLMFSFFFQFLVWIQNPNEEGLYNLYFHNCLNYKDGNHAFVNLSVSNVYDDYQLSNFC